MTSVIRASRRVRAPHDAVWQALSTAEGLARWQADEANGGLDLGRFGLSWPSLGVSMDVEVVNATEGERLVLRSSLGLTEITVGDEVTVTHTTSDERDIDGQRASWELSLAILAHAVEAQRGRNRVVFWFGAPVRTRPDAVHVFFTDAAALQTWLGTSGGIGEAGTPWEVTLQSGQRLAGSVVCNVPGHDVLLAFDGGASLMALRTLPGPRDDERLVALMLSAWGATHPPLPLLVGLERALGRLALVLRPRGDA